MFSSLWFCRVSNTISWLLHGVIIWNRIVPVYPVVKLRFPDYNKIYLDGTVFVSVVLMINIAYDVDIHSCWDGWSNVMVRFHHSMTHNVSSVSVEWISTSCLQIKCGKFSFFVSPQHFLERVVRMQTETHLLSIVLTWLRMVLVILWEESLNSDSQRTTTLHNKSLNTDKNKIRKQKQKQKTNDDVCR